MLGSVVLMTVAAPIVTQYLPAPDFNSEELPTLHKNKSYELVSSGSFGRSRKYENVAGNKNGIENNNVSEEDQTTTSITNNSFAITTESGQLKHKKRKI